MDRNPPITTQERALLNPPRHDWQQHKTYFAWCFFNSAVRTLLKGAVIRQIQIITWKFDRVRYSSPEPAVSHSRGALNLSLIWVYSGSQAPSRYSQLHVSAVQSHSWKQVFRITFVVYTSKYTCQRKMCHKNSFMWIKLLITVTCTLRDVSTRILSMRIVIIISRVARVT